MSPDIKAYNQELSDEYRAACDMLAAEISAGLPEATSKVWHAHPVWFIDGNPIVGYSLRKAGINLMFWSGQTFDEPGLSPEGKFKAAEIKYTDVSQINKQDLVRWLEKSRNIQWDYKNIVKKKGRLDRIK